MKKSLKPAVKDLFQGSIFGVHFESCFKVVMYFFIGKIQTMTEYSSSHSEEA